MELILTGSDKKADFVEIRKNLRTRQNFVRESLRDFVSILRNGVGEEEMDYKPTALQNEKMIEYLEKMSSNMPIFVGNVNINTQTGRNDEI